MFETFVDSEIPAPALLGREDIQMWPLVYQRGASLWFYVECRSAYEENSPLRMIFLQSLENFLGFNANESCVIEKVYLVTPNYINQSAGWKMDSLDEILIGTVPELDRYGTTQSAYIYVLENGKRYIDSLLDDGTNLQNLKSLFKGRG